MAKRGRRLTREEKACVLKQGKNPNDYMFAYNISESYFKIRHKTTNVECTVDRFRKAKNKWDY